MEQRGASAGGRCPDQESYDNLKLDVVNADTGELVNQMELGPQTAGDFEFIWNGGNLVTRLPLQELPLPSNRFFGRGKR